MHGVFFTLHHRHFYSLVCSLSFSVLRSFTWMSVCVCERLFMRVCFVWFVYFDGSFMQFERACVLVCEREGKYVRLTKCAITIARQTTHINVHTHSIFEKIISWIINVCTFAIRHSIEYISFSHFHCLSVCVYCICLRLSLPLSRHHSLTHSLCV